MDKKFEKIINDGMKNGKTYEEINAELKAAGANFHLDKEFAVAGWTEAEMAEGFKPGAPAKDVQRELDMRRKAECAGTMQIQVTAGGRYEVYYDADGYAEKAIKVK